MRRWLREASAQMRHSLRRMDSEMEIGKELGVLAVSLS